MTNHFEYEDWRIIRTPLYWEADKMNPILALAHKIELIEFYINNEEDFKTKMDWIRGMDQNKIYHYIDNMLNIKDYLSPKSTADRYYKLIKNYI